MKKVYFFGTGFCAELYAEKAKIALKSLGDYQVVGFLDNDREKTGTMFLKERVYHPDVLHDNPCDLVLLFLMNEDIYETVFWQLAELIQPERICDYCEPLRRLLNKRYADTEDTEIKETLEYISDHKISVYNQFLQEDHSYDEVKWDRSIDLPYIDFMTVEGKTVAMYYPRNFRFMEKDGSLFVYGLMWEQSDGSPHLYVREGHHVSQGDVVIDAGVCEGNFALRYIDIASHIYLFEIDHLWLEPLYHTFKNYGNKVTMVPKAVSDRTAEGFCRIDDVVSGRKVDFIKMDIEGAELSALHGAEQTFRRNNISASICSYHRNGDEKKIRVQLEKYGYQTSVSEGYMLFLHSDDTWEIGDLRRGIVYGDKK